MIQQMMNTLLPKNPHWYQRIQTLSENRRKKEKEGKEEERRTKE